MFEKSYKRRPLTVRALQFDGTDEMLMYVCNTYRNLFNDGVYLYFNGNYGDQGVNEGDYLIIEGLHAVDVIDRDVFEDLYEQIK